MVDGGWWMDRTNDALHIYALHTYIYNKYVEVVSLGVSGE